MARSVCFSRADLLAVFTPEEIRAFMSARDVNLHINQQLQFLAEGKYQKYLQAVAVKKLVNDMPDTVQGINDWVKGLVGTSRKNIGRSGIEARADAIASGVHDELAELMIKSAPKKLGWSIRHDAHKNIIKVLFNENVNDPSVVAAAGSWKNATEGLRVRFNKAGGLIEKKDQWVMTTSHDSLRVYSAGYDKWLANIRNKLDYGKMQITESEFVAFSRSVYDNITSEGMSKIDPGQIPPGGRSRIASRHSQHRFFEFNNADDWLTYQKDFGNQNIYGAMMEHVHMMSKEIAAMETFGPNAALGKNYIADAAIQKMMKLGENKNAAEKSTRIMKREWDQLMGNTSPENHNMAGTMATGRNVMTTALLPGAVVSAITDPFIAPVISFAHGTSGFVFGRAFISAFATGVVSRAKVAREAARLLMGIEHMIDAAHSSSRMTEVVGHGKSARGAEVAMRLGMLNPWTVAGKIGAKTDLLHMLSKSRFNQKNMRLFERYGIDSSDLAALAGAQRTKSYGINVVDLKSMPQANREKFVAMINAETRFAIPEPDVKTRAMMTRATKTGSIEGEAIRAAGQFKSHPFHFLFGTVARLWYETPAVRSAAIPYLIASTTTAGIIGAQLYELSRGRETLPWLNEDGTGVNRDLLLKGMVRAGTFGIVQDLVMKDSRTAGAYAEMLAGPMAGMVIEHVLIGILTPVDMAIGGEFDKAGKKLMENSGKAVVDMNPFSRLPYIRAMVDQGMNQWILEHTDDKAHIKSLRKERLRVKEHKNPMRD